MENSANNYPIAHSVIEQRVDRGLGLLLEAHEYAVGLTRDRWDFAVEISALREAGLTHSDLRWLVCKGFVEHALDITPMGRDARDFQPVGILNFAERTCFVLTESGIHFASQRLRNVSSQTKDANVEVPESCVVCGVNRKAADGNGKAVVRPQVPKWDGNRHELRLGHALIKVFKLPSRNQEAILLAFEEECWPPRIDDPLPPQGDVDPKRRLHDTIKSLNRHQKNALLRFMGDGTGEGIRWEFRRSELGGNNGKRGSGFA